MNSSQIDKDSYAEQQQLEAVLAQTIAIANSKVDAVEVAINKSTGINVSTHHGETENIEFNSGGALGITVYQNHKKGTASTNDLSPQSIEQADRKSVV